MKPQEQHAIIYKYVVAGVPASSLKAMCKEAKTDYKKLCKWLEGQTMAVVGGEAIIYTGDLERFICGKKVIG